MKDNLDSGFFGFFVKSYKVSFLLTFMLILYGIFSLWQIPKESSPDIEFGIISINTIYTGVDPSSIDDLITSKIESEIEDLEGINKITSTSSLGLSSIMVELNTDADTRDMLSDIRERVDRVNLPSEAEDPVVSEIGLGGDRLFEFYLYTDKNNDFYQILDDSRILKDRLERLSLVDNIAISPDPDYDILIEIDRLKFDNLGLSLGNLTNIIRAYNKNTPLGNYRVGDKNYDFRVSGEISDIQELSNIPIISGNNGILRLGDIATIKKDYKSSDNINIVGKFRDYPYSYVKLTVNKTSNASIFGASRQSKNLIEEILLEDSFNKYNVEYINDLAQAVMNDYSDLADSGVKTLILVFVLLFIFLGLKESVIATLLIPLAFFVTFIVLNSLGYTLNFLTNFSLLLTLGIALDTIIVIVEGSSAKMKMGYTPRTAVLLTVKEFKAPLIAGTSTTLAVFLPMMMLPGVMGKFLAYIPITVFITLLAGLALSLTINTAIFSKLNRNKKYYVKENNEDIASMGPKGEILLLEREGKYEKKLDNMGFRYKFFGALESVYYNILSRFVKKGLFRFFVILTPLFLLILSFRFLAPNIGFTIFPATDTTFISVGIEASVGSNKEVFKPHIDYINSKISSIEEVLVYSISIKDNKLDVSIELYDKSYRDNNNLRNSFLVESQIEKYLGTLSSYGFQVETRAAQGGPPSGSPVGIKLVSESNEYLDNLILVSSDFESYLKTLEGTRNVGNTSSRTPGQFVFNLKKDNLANLGINPNDILNELFFMSSGAGAGSMKIMGDDIDLKVALSSFSDDTLSPSDVMDLTIQTQRGPVRVGNVAEYVFTPAVSNINREDGKIVIQVNSDLQEGYFSNELQPKLMEFANSYNFPEGVSFSAGGEAEENRELIVSTFVSFLIAIFLIFTILVLQFNSYLQPALVLYSIILALLGVNIGLYVTGNPYSMPFAIGFIALTGIVVNNAIILIDRINYNLSKGLDPVVAISESGKSRLRPILLTTLTTTFGILPLALQDEFWAGLGFTVIFGLMFASIMTLFVTPSMYYQLFLREKKKGFFLFRLLKRSKKRNS